MEKVKGERRGGRYQDASDAANLDSIAEGVAPYGEAPQ